LEHKLSLGKKPAERKKIKRTKEILGNLGTNGEDGEKKAEKEEKILNGSFVAGCFELHLYILIFLWHSFSMFII